MKRVLLTGDGYTPDHLDRLKQAGFDVRLDPNMSPDVLRRELLEAEAYILGGDERVTGEMLSKAPRLSVISFVGTGYADFINVEAARSRGIAVLSTPGAGTAAVVEHTIGLVLGLVRGLFAQNSAVKQGKGTASSDKEVADLLVGIVGMGLIAQRVATILKSTFGCHVCYFSRTRKIALEETLGIRYLELEGLLAECDLAIILASTTTPEALIGERVLSGCKRGMLLVNTANPHLVAPVPLLTAIERGHVAAAAFDGYWVEPVPTPEGDPYGFLRLPDNRFIVTPHSAAKTASTWRRMLNGAVDNLILHTTGRLA